MLFTAIFLIIFVSIILCLVLLLLDLTPVYKQVLLCMGFAVVIISTIVAIFGPKAVSIANGEDIESDFHLGQRLSLVEERRDGRENPSVYASGYASSVVGDKDQKDSVRYIADSKSTRVEVLTKELQTCQSNLAQYEAELDRCQQLLRVMDSNNCTSNALSDNHGAVSCSVDGSIDESSPILSSNVQNSRHVAQTSHRMVVDSVSNEVETDESLLF